jgi:endonuclease/exonuclease/phosphatase (EEP) superfamily protein YafD
MKGMIKFLWFLYKCFAFYTLIIYILILWIPFDGWLAGFMMMSFPAVIIVHIISLLAWLIVDAKKAFLPLIMLLAGGIFLPRTYRFGNNAGNTSVNEKTFKVMSYNTHVFQRNSDIKIPYVKRHIREMKAWVSNSKADILCMPEYYDNSTNLFSVNDALRKKGFQYYAFYNKARKQQNKTYSGLAVFSKFPIIASRDTIFESQNGMIQADIKIKADTVRIIALHLYSMTLQLGNLVSQKEMEGVKKESKTTLLQMKRGFTKRSMEVRVLESWVKSSPYPIIVCGDFNEVPYGFVYGRMRKLLTNSFEEKGNGFGFTFNHLPYFIRIDHQFYSSDKLQLTDFTTLNRIKHSDHYPIQGEYTFIKKEKVQQN